jgi:hypothetical protein
MPFDGPTWVYFFLSMLAVLVAIQLINRLDKFKQYFIYGGHVSSPTLNVAAIFFGVRQAYNYHLLPQRSSTRVMFIFFMFFCLIFRTCYQKISFELMSADLREPTRVHSHYDLINSNYTIYASTNDRHALESDFHFANAANGKVTDYHGLQNIYFGNCHHSTQNAAILTNSMISFASLISVCSSWRTLPGSLKRIPITVAITSNHPLTRLAVEIGQRMIESGIQIKSIQGSERVQYSAEYLDFNVRVLALADVGHYFVIWMFSLIAPITAFIVELIVAKYWKKPSKSVYQTNFECIDMNDDNEENRAELYVVEDDHEIGEFLAQNFDQTFVNENAENFIEFHAAQPEADYIELLSEFTEEGDEKLPEQESPKEDTPKEAAT